MKKSLECLQWLRLLQNLGPPRLLGGFVYGCDLALALHIVSTLCSLAPFSCHVLGSGSCVKDSWSWVRISWLQNDSNRSIVCERVLP